VLAVLALGLAIWMFDVLLGLLQTKIPLDDRQRAWLALAAPYFEVHGFRSGDLGGIRPLGRLRIRYLLRKDWGIHDRQTAVDRIRRLLEEGHRSDPYYRDPDQPPADLAIVDRSLLAWDCTRAVWIARCCYSVGYLEAEAVWVAAASVAQLVRGKFRSWAEWGRSFAAGRVIWTGGVSSYYEIQVEKLLKDSSSVWSRIPWEIATQP